MIFLPFPVLAGCTKNAHYSARSLPNSYSIPSIFKVFNYFRRIIMSISAKTGYLLRNIMVILHASFRTEKKLQPCRRDEAFVK